MTTSQSRFSVINATTYHHCLELEENRKSRKTELWIYLRVNNIDSSSIQQVASQIGWEINRSNHKEETFQNLINSLLHIFSFLIKLTKKRTQRMERNHFSSLLLCFHVRSVTRLSWVGSFTTSTRYSLHAYKVPHTYAVLSCAGWRVARHRHSITRRRAIVTRTNW